MHLPPEHDDADRLVYADWLEIEKNAARRAELIRADVKQRDVLPRARRRHPEVHAASRRYRFLLRTTAWHDDETLVALVPLLTTFSQRGTLAEREQLLSLFLDRLDPVFPGYKDLVACLTLSCLAAPEAQIIGAIAPYFNADPLPEGHWVAKPAFVNTVTYTGVMSNWVEAALHGLALFYRQNQPTTGRVVLSLESVLRYYAEQPHVLFLRPPPTV